MDDVKVAGAQSDDPEESDGNTFYALFTRLPVSWRVVIGAVVGVLILASVARWLPDMKERMKFFTESTLAWLVFVIVAVQAYIYHWQAKIMGDSLVIGTRSYVGIHSVDCELTGDSYNRPRTFIVKIENIGKVPAKDIEVVTTVSLLAPNASQFAGNPRGFYSQTFSNPFGGVQLYPGNLKFEIRIPLLLTFSLSELTLIMQQKAVFTAHVKIAHNDGFNMPQRCEFFFHYLARANRWIPRALVPVQEIWQNDYAEKQEPAQKPN